MGHHHRDLAGWGEVEPPPPLPPEMVVTGNAQTIADGDNTPSAGDHTDFGLSATLSTISRTFNIAVSVSNLTGVSVALSGGGAGGFTITAQPSGTINAGANSNFTIRYDALTQVAYSATVTIASNELPDFAFSIRASSSYYERVSASADLTRHNKLNDGSGTALLDSGPSGFTATGIGITWNAGASPLLEASVSLDGALDAINIYDATFASNFSFNEGFLLVWLKVASAGVWTDGASRTILSIRRDGNNRILISKTATNNTVNFLRVANGTSQSFNAAGFTETGWLAIALSYSVLGNALMGFKNGSQVGTTQTGLVNAAGTGLSSTQTVLGANNITPAAVHNGDLSQFIVFSSAQDANKTGLMVI
jgi:hypothetical protein